MQWPAWCRRHAGDVPATASPNTMESTIRLMTALAENDDKSAAEILDKTPEAASGRGRDGESPLLTALYRGKAEIAARIAEHRDIDLFEAAALGRADMIAKLHDAGASLSGRSFDGWSALHLAAFMGHANVVHELLTRSAPVDAISENSSANTPLCAAIAGHCSRDVVVMLLDAGADVNVRAAVGVTPLHLAASRGADLVIRELLSRGANTSACMEDGTTVVGMAEARGHRETADLLQHPP